jgi:hypothetical protein
MTDQRPIPNFPGYVASSTGEVTNNAGLNAPVPVLQTSGVVHLALSRDGSQTVVPRAELVLAAWGFEPTDDLPYIVHLNGQLNDDALANLDLASEPEPNRLTPVGIRYGWGTGKAIEQVDASPSGGSDTGPAFDLRKPLHTKTGRKFK